MFDTMLSAAQEALSFGEKMAIGGKVTLLGMGTVFAVLALLWGLVELLHVLLQPLSKPKKAKKSVVVTDAPKTDVAPAVQTDDGETVAAIIAAICAATGKAPGSFRVVSFKRANRNFASGK